MSPGRVIDGHITGKDRVLRHGTLQLFCEACIGAQCRPERRPRAAFHGCEIGAKIRIGHPVFQPLSQCRRDSSGIAKDKEIVRIRPAIGLGIDIDLDQRLGQSNREIHCLVPA